MPCLGDGSSVKQAKEAGAFPLQVCSPGPRDWRGRVGFSAVSQRPRAFLRSPSRPRRTSRRFSKTWRTLLCIRKSTAHIKTRSEAANLKCFYRGTPAGLETSNAPLIPQDRRTSHIPIMCYVHFTEAIGGGCSCSLAEGWPRGSTHFGISRASGQLCRRS